MVRDEMIKAYNKGWVLIPLHKNEKKPNTTWQKFVARKPTQAEYKGFKFENYAIVCGEVSGITVVDLDMPSAADTLKALNIRMSDFLTPMVRTPNGYHLYFKYSPNAKTGVGVVGPGIDIRNDGSYVVGPGSVVQGMVYEWMVQPDAQPLSDMASEFLTGSKLLLHKNTPMLNDTMTVGSRNNAMAGLAGALVGRQVPADIVVETMLYINQRMFNPPLAEDEVKATAASIETRRKDEV